MRILVTGSRTWDDRETMEKVLLPYLNDYNRVTLVVGDAKGADAMLKDIAHLSLVKVEEYRADWQRYGKYAGPRRNCDMLDSGIDLVLAFRIGGEASRGTTHCIGEARRRGIKCIIYDWPGEAPRRLQALDRRR